MASLADVETLTPFGAASLINDRFLLTAAHCLAPVTPREIRVILGHHKTSNLTGAVVARAAAFLMHPDFDPQDPHQRFDVALIRLEEPLAFSERISPICLPSDETPSEGWRELEVAGWGYTKRSGEPSDVLMHANLPEVPLDGCKRLHYAGRVTQRHICAGNASVDTCDGDSGGPLMTQDAGVDGGRVTAIGVVSWGIACAHSYYPAVFTRVSSYTDWIASLTADARFCSNGHPG